MKFKYEIVPVGSLPTWEKESTQEFTVPVAVGEKIKPSGLGSPLQKVVDIEHYPDVSVLYVE